MLCAQAMACFRAMASYKRHACKIPTRNATLLVRGVGFRAEGELAFREFHLFRRIHQGMKRDLINVEVIIQCFLQHFAARFSGLAKPPSNR